MNLPNRLTVSRAVCVPLVEAGLLLGGLWRVIAFGLFIAASVTDLFDGRIARSHNLVTNLGKFLDPMADKLLVICTMASLCYLHELHIWLLLTVLIRELSVDGLRLAASAKGTVIAAGKLGKWKTTVQMILLAFCMLFCGGSVYNAVPDFTKSIFSIIKIILSILTALLTLLSGAVYFKKNISVLME